MVLAREDSVLKESIVPITNPHINIFVLSKLSHHQQSHIVWIPRHCDQRPSSCIKPLRGRKRHREQRIWRANDFESSIFSSATSQLQASCIERIASIPAVSLRFSSAPNASPPPVLGDSVLGVALIWMPRHCQQMYCTGLGLRNARAVRSSGEGLIAPIVELLRALSKSRC